MEEARAKCPTCGSEFPAMATFCPECGYVVPFSSPVASPPAEKPETPHPQSNVVYVQPSPVAARESNWGPWVVVAVIVVLVGGGLVLWNNGYLGTSPGSAQPATNVNIDNSPQMSSEQPPLVTEPAALPLPAPSPPPATPPPATPPAAPGNQSPSLDIISVKGQPLETGDVEWKYGYTLRVRNNTSAAVTATFRIQFLDEQNYPVDDDLLSDITIPANDEVEFSGVDRIKSELAVRIHSLLADMR